MMKSSSVLNSGDGNKKTVDNATPKSLYISPVSNKTATFFFLFYSSKLNDAQCYSSKYSKKFMKSTAHPAQTPIL